MKLESAVAVITGATRGVGRGVARELARERARVFITGRSVPHHEPFDEPITAIRCDHGDDPQVDAVFERIVHEAETIDVLVNSVWGGYERMIDNGAFSRPTSSAGPWRPWRRILMSFVIAARWSLPQRWRQSNGFTDLDGKTPRPLTLADV